MVTKNSTNYFVKKFIKWELIEKRLDQFKNINKYFPKSLLLKCENTKPYYCHYMSWRLGTWPLGCDSVFKFIDILLNESEKLSNWENEQSIIQTNDFQSFWGLLWQMQVAHYLMNISSFDNVCWNPNKKGGPDLIAQKDETKFYVECYTFQKSYKFTNFLSELLTLINPNIKLKHQLFLKHGFSNQNILDVFNTVLANFLDEGCLKQKIKEAKVKYPVKIYSSSDQNMHVYIDGEDVNKYMPNILPMGGGNPIVYSEHMINEAIQNKYKRNNLENCRPNLLAINFLVGDDLQLIIKHSYANNININNDLTCSLDNIMLSCCGIDEYPNNKNSILKKNNNNLPI